MTEAALFYEAATILLGSDFLDDVQRAVETIRNFPHAGEAIDSTFRRILLHRFPFSLIYAVEQDGIVIIAVAHHVRHPNYWRSRIC